MNRKKRTTNKTLRPVNYNAGNIIWYRRELLAIIREMNDDVKNQIIPIFEDSPLAMDANPVQLLRGALRALSKSGLIAS